MSDKLVRRFVKYEYDPTRAQSPLTNIVVYDLETFGKDRAVTYCNCMYKLGKSSRKAIEI